MNEVKIPEERFIELVNHESVIVSDRRCWYE